MDIVHPDTTMKKTLILLTFLACSTCYAQPDTLWTCIISGISGATGIEVIHTIDDGFALGGHGSPGIEGRRDCDFALVKTDSFCQTE